MESSIYIGQEHIEVIGYAKSGNSVKVLDYAYAQLPERTMINGNIAEAPLLIDQLNKLKLQKPKLFTDVSLVIDSNSLSVKEIPVPKLNKKQYMKVIREEMNVSSQNEILIDYTLLSKPEKKLALLALSTGKPFISSYMDVFHDTGIKLKSIRVGLQTITSYIKTKRELRDKTFVLNIVDGISMFSIVFSMGQNVFSTRSRLAFENELGLIQSIADNLPPLMQFMKSEKLPDIEKSYYLGLTEKQLEMLSLHGENLAGFNLLDGVKNASLIENPCHLSFMCAFNSDGMDLIESYKNIEKNMREYKQASFLWVLPVVGVILLTAAYLTPTLMTRPLLEEIEEIEQYINSPDTVAKVQEVDELTGETARMSAVITQMNDAVTLGSSYRRLTNKLLDLISRTEPSVIIENYRLDAQGIISLTGSSDTESDSAKYVEMLTSNKLIGSVSYTGYKYDSSSRYRFSLQITLAD